MHPRPTPCSLSPARRLAAATVVVAAVAAACAGSPATVDTGQAGGPATAPRGSGTTPAAPGTTTTPGTNRQASPACPDGANLDNLS
ncbi:MAG: hypothetical protein HYX32_09875, partial [Actinobacteria bacterium]|nr:hypothetical protein [Actinomycetota bacterium]